MKEPHAIMRARERLGEDWTLAHLHKVLADIRDGRAMRLISDWGNGGEIWLAASPVTGRLFRAVYKPEADVIATVMTLSMKARGPKHHAPKRARSRKADQADAGVEADAEPVDLEAFNAPEQPNTILGERLKEALAKKDAA